MIISKTNAESTVHRRGRMDYIGIKKLDPAGKVVGEHRFIGLFTSRAYAEDAEQIPILRDKLRHILESAGVVVGSHDYKEINTIFNSMPKEELFLASPDEIGADIRTVLTSYHTDEIRVSLREDALHRGMSAMVIIPSDRYSGKVRDQIEEMLTRALEGEVLNFHLALGGGDQTRLHYYLSGRPERMHEIRSEALEQGIGDVLRSWSDRVREGLERSLPPEEARRQAWRYGAAFATEYQAATNPDVAARDILELEAMQAERRRLSVSFSNSADMSWVPGDEPVTELKLYLIRERLVLSDFMPVLENAGLRVIAVNPYEVKGGGLLPALICVFAVQEREGSLDERREAAREGKTGVLAALGGVTWPAPSAPARIEATVAETIRAVRAGDLSNDILNGLVLATGLHWREPEQLAEEGKEQYRTLIRGLLDVTDNLDLSGEVVLSYDDPDPYLVVAADKGTAKFSDLPLRLPDRRRPGSLRAPLGAAQAPRHRQPALGAVRDQVRPTELLRRGGSLDERSSREAAREGKTGVLAALGGVTLLAEDRALRLSVLLAYNRKL